MPRHFTYQCPEATVLYNNDEYLANVNVHVRYMLSSVRLSVTFVRPTRPVEIFGNVSMPFGTLAIHRHPRKILQRSSQGNLFIGEGLNGRGVAEYSGLDISKAISRKYCSKLVLITNRKSYMRFQLVPKSLTLNDLERRNCPYFALFHGIR